MSRRNRIAFFFLTFVCMLCVDRVSKSWASENLSFTQHSHSVGFLDMVLVHNEGAAFGMGQGQTWLFLVIAAVVVVAIVCMLMRGHLTRTVEVVSAALIVAGAVGNVIDRLTTTYVVDFLSFTFIDFPVFNFADCCITVGAVLMVIAVFTSVKAEKDVIFDELQAEDEKRREQARAAAEAAEKAARAAEDDEFSWWDDEDESNR